MRGDVCHHFVRQHAQARRTERLFLGGDVFFYSSSQEGSPAGHRAASSPLTARASPQSREGKVNSAFRGLVRPNAGAEEEMFNHLLW